MDGDVPDLPALRALCDRYKAGLIVDEAHALGVFGPEGSGMAAATGVRPDVLVGTLSKALGALGVQGGFVAGSELLRTWLWNRARPFVFSTGMSPLLCELAKGQLEQVRSDDEARRRLLDNARRLIGRLHERAVPVLGNPAGPILPILLGPPEAAVKAAGYLLEQRVLVQAIRPPTVPHGSSRIRLSLSSELTDADIERLATLVPEACRAALA
jgi:8-amino-7-oxononanoate synthase